MLARVLSSALLGVDAYIVQVETDISTGLPSFNTVGLPDSAVKESKDRVTAAIKTPIFIFPLVVLLSTWPRPMCGKRAQRLTCRSPSVS